MSFQGPLEFLLSCMRVQVFSNNSEKIKAASPNDIKHFQIDNLFNLQVDLLVFSLSIGDR